MYSQATEGFSNGKTNNEGYYNLGDYNKDKKIDILVMGSSHMEASQVQQSESTASILQEKLNNYNIYNIGTSGHTFITCFSNLDAAINKYNPSKYIIIETPIVTFSKEELTKALNDNIEDISSYNGGIIGILQHNQFLRLLYHQLKSFLNLESDDDIVVNYNENNTINNDSSLYINQLLNEMQSKVKDTNTKFIIMYHPSTVLNEDGSLTLSSENENVEEFSKLCKENGILFLDMSNRYREEYKKNYVLPYGFSNTSVGRGHLNKYGHEMIADELYKLIKEEE